MLSIIEKEIIEYGKKLAELDPENRALKNARKWWKEGRLCRYSNEDFDILNSLVSSIAEIKIKEIQDELVEDE